MKMLKSRPQPPRPDRRRSIRGSFSWIDHRFLREGFDQGLTRLEKLFYYVLVAVSNQDGVSFYSDARLAELLDIRFPHELDGARIRIWRASSSCWKAGAGGHDEIRRVASPFRANQRFSLPYVRRKGRRSRVGQCLPRCPETPPTLAALLTGLCL